MKINSKKNIKKNRKYSRKNVRKNKRSRKNVGKYSRKNIGKYSRKNVKQYSRKNIMRGGVWFMDPFNTNYQKLLNNNDPSFKEWIIYEIDDNEFNALVQALDKNTTLKTLIFAGRTKIRTPGASKIAGKLWSNPEDPSKNETLTILSINDNSIEGTNGLARMLKYNNTLKELYIGGNHISDEIKEDGAQAIANALKENKNSALTILHIGNNKIGDKGAIAFADMLRINNTLKELYINNKIISSVGASALKEALEVNTTLTTLDIIDKDNNILPEILDQIAILIDRNRKSFINNKVPKIIIRDLNHIRKLKTIRKQPENEFFNSLIETGKRLQNLTLNKKIQTVLLLNNGSKNNKTLLNNSNLSMIGNSKNSLINKEDIDMVVKYINSLSAAKKNKLKMFINRLNIEEVRYMMFYIPVYNHLATLDNDKSKETFIEEYLQYLNTNTLFLTDLPEEIWGAILNYLPFKDTKSFLKAINI